MFRSLVSARALLNTVGIEARIRAIGNNVGGALGRAGARPFSEDTNNSPTIGEIVQQWSRRFENEGVPEPVESIEHLVAHVLGTTKILDLVTVEDKQLTEAQTEKLKSLCECRLSRMPVQYIIGEWDFRELTLKLVPPVFIPRPETEVLVDYVLKRLRATNMTKCEMLEIGCGSGAISLSVAHSCPKVNCVAIDRAVHACELTKENRDNLGLQDRVTIAHATLKEDGTIDTSACVNGSDSIDLNSRMFDLIVSNPPYIPTKEVSDLPSEIIIYEDIRALDGGEDGMTVIKQLMRYAATNLKTGGGLLLEVGPGQPQYINFLTTKFPELKLQFEHTHKDYSNTERFVEMLKL